MGMTKFKLLPKPAHRQKRFHYVGETFISCFPFSIIAWSIAMYNSERFCSIRVSSLPSFTPNFIQNQAHILAKIKYLENLGNHL